ncbi:hypothetical protein OKJ48_18415 [Streptomyces kunmingensis]|uniref:DUF3137 domain-containing protein n=1 Tax=Streptomyces kunmingensis TaxID=68225 RepID=A0ABU6CEC7_9ACTN|nr:hypothetical protein [Streptomyces kunmingensis]MEB3962210.1 hypothetical protein [Streptomyces kunmingensis]
MVDILVKVLLFAFIAGMFTLVIRAFVRSGQEDKQVRRGWEELAQVAAARGWTHERRAAGRATEFCGVGPMPGSGENLTAWHYITGEFRGRSFTCFEYRYSNPLSGSSQVGESKKLTFESVFLVSAPGSGPFLQVGRPGKFDTVMGRGPRTLLGVPEFDEKFRVDTEDQTFARTILSDDVRAFLLSDQRAEKNPLRVRHDELFTWYTGTLSPQALEDRLNYLCDVLDRIPAQAWASA